MDRGVRFTSSCCQIDAASSPDAMCRFCCKSRRFQLQMGWLDLLERPLSSALRGRWHYRLVLTPALVTQDMHPLLAVVERSASRACEDSAQSLPVRTQTEHPTVRVTATDRAAECA